MKREDVLLGAALAACMFLQLRGLNAWPFLIIGILAYAFFRHGTPLMGQKRFVALSGTPGTVKVGFDDVGGHRSAKEELREALEFLANPEDSLHLGIRPLKGILLSGPPGTGKTLLAKAAATYTESLFISASGSEFVEVYAGVGAQRVRQIFQQVRTMARRSARKSAIIFLDEMEVLGGSRGRNSSHLEYDQTLNQLLVEMDGIGQGDDVRLLVIGATNRIDLVDPALVRPGRFDRVVRVALPDREGRRQILAIHMRNKPLAGEVDLDGVARETFGFSGAHLESLANEAAILARRQGQRTISRSHITEAIEKVILGEKLDRAPSADERHRVAVHESGHALVSELLRPGSVNSVTVSPRSGALGYMRQSPREDRYLMASGDIKQEIAVLLAGGLAEETILGEASTGPSDDYKRAMEMARKMVYCGMSTLGLVDPEGTPGDAVHRAVKEIIDGQTKIVLGLLKSQRSHLERIAQRLVDEESLDGQAVRGEKDSRESEAPEELPPLHRLYREAS
jgi:ATP-dependent metalloprotease FtsH